MTWGFFYLAALIVGLVLAAVTGMVRGLAKPGRLRDVVAPHQDAQSALWSRLGRCLAAALTAFGAVGLVTNAFHSLSSRTSLTWAIGAAVLAALLARLCTGSRCRAERQVGLATVVREIRPGSYGQVRLEGGSVVLAAQGAEEDVLPVGTAVEVLDAEHSVLRVRRLTP